jgi:hypothetical protein
VEGAHGGARPHRHGTGAIGRVKVWDGEAFTLLHDLDCGPAIKRVLAFESAEGPHRLLVALRWHRGLQVWDPEEGRLLHDGINRDCPVETGTCSSRPRAGTSWPSWGPRLQRVRYGLRTNMAEAWLARGWPTLSAAPVTLLRS